MKLLLVWLAVVCLCTNIRAQEQEVYLWPVSGAKAGSRILSQPQDYVGGELNFDNLFVGVPLGSLIVAPADGVISFLSVTYWQRLGYSITYSFTDNFDRSRAEILKGEVGNIDPKYLNGHIAINTGNGRMLHINGLTGNRPFKTGQKIRRGDTLGYSGYSYHKIKEPSIAVAVSQNTKSADPMSPFGLKSSFMPSAEIKPVVSLTKEQAREDFNVYMDVLKECYPGLYDVISKDELEYYIQATVKKIDSREGDMAYADFRDIIVKTVARIHDSHISLRPPVWRENRPPCMPQVFIGWIGDTLRCTNATKEYKHLLGKQIVKVNGLPADSAKKVIVSQIGSYDAQASGYVDSRLATMGFRLLFDTGKESSTFDLALEFTDGSVAEVKEINVRDKKFGYVGDWSSFFNQNRHGGWFKCRMLSDTVAYVGLTSFELKEVQVEQIAAFIDSVSKAAVPYLIVDVRNNYGGQAEVLEKLYSYVAGDVTPLAGYEKVNKPGGFSTLNYSMNYAAMEEDIFPGYATRPGKEGYYAASEADRLIRPDSVINYKGRLYVLTNENSVSAATLFPAMAVRNHRGAVVGRETRTAYHFMNALKFANIRLPHSKIDIAVPLVYCAFDTVVNERVPYGRGILPDYEVPVSMDELSSVNGDAILNYTLGLIREGKYISEADPFAVEPLPANGGDRTGLIPLLGIGGVLLCGVGIIRLIRKRKNFVS